MQFPRGLESLSQRLPAPFPCGPLSGSRVPVPCLDWPWGAAGDRGLVPALEDSCRGTGVGCRSSRFSGFTQQAHILGPLRAHHVLSLGSGDPSVALTSLWGSLWGLHICSTVGRGLSGGMRLAPEVSCGFQAWKEQRQCPLVPSLCGVNLGALRSF